MVLIISIFTNFFYCFNNLILLNILFIRELPSIWQFFYFMVIYIKGGYTMKNNFKKWLIASLIRAIRTFAEVILATIGTNYVRFNEVDWVGALSIGLTAFILTLLIWIG